MHKPTDEEREGWMKVLREAHNKTCPECSHSMYAHSELGCSIYLTKDFKSSCACSSSQYRTNEEIIKNDYYHGDDPYENEY